MNILSRLADAIAWSSQATLPVGGKYAFTPAIEPPFRMWGADQPRRAELLNTVCERRSALLRQLGVVPAADVELSKGQILAFCLDDNIGCSSCQSETVRELFDDVNVPGWDTWFALYQPLGRGECLLCWIRQDDIADVENAMRVEPTECMFWLDKASLPRAEPPNGL